MHLSRAKIFVIMLKNPPNILHDIAYCAGAVLGEPVVDRQAGATDGADGEGLLLYR